MLITDTKPVIDQLTTDLEIILNLWLGCGNKKGQEIYRQRYTDLAAEILEILQWDYEVANGGA
tara:strand:- start:497 stop:685 length:189 start_codon:yes stop_codon:yes gene_type:complete